MDTRDEPDHDEGGVPAVRISIRVDDPDSISPRLRDALSEVAAALAAEEVTLSDDVLAEIQERSEVAGFSMGALRIGDLGGGFSGSRLEFCGKFHDHGGTGTCTLYGAEEGDPPISKCTLRFW